MQEILTFEQPTRVIMHFKEDEEIALKHGTRLVYHQVTIDQAEKGYSSCGEFIRFDHGPSEVHGWVRIESVVIDSVLETYQGEDKWLRTANG